MMRDDLDWCGNPIIDWEPSEPPKTADDLEADRASWARSEQLAAPNGQGKEPPPVYPAADRRPAAPTFPSPRPISELRRQAESKRWLWHGFLAPGAITLLSALWKVGKTTLLAHLLKMMDQGGDFCGHAVQPGRVLYVTEESEDRWAERRDALGLADHVAVLERPFLFKPDAAGWRGFIAHLRGELARKPADLIVFDTLGNLWPVKDENAAAEVQAALMPLHQLTEQAALVLSAHLRKGDGQEATGTRGSGAIPAFVDTIVELRRFDASDRSDRKRVLSGYGRSDETPQELVVELGPYGYVPHGDRQEVLGKELRAAIVALLPNVPPGMTEEEIHGQWPDKPAPGKAKLLAELRRGTDAGEWKRGGAGKKGSPFTYWIPAA